MAQSFFAKETSPFMETTTKGETMKKHTNAYNKKNRPKKSKDKDTKVKKIIAVAVVATAVAMIPSILNLKDVEEDFVYDAEEEIDNWFL